MKPKPMSRLAIAVLILAACADCLHAHDRTTSYSSWRLSSQQAKVVLTMSEVDVASLRLPDGEAALAQYARSHLILLAAENSCPVEGPTRRLPASAGRIRLEWLIAVPGGSALDIRSDLFGEINSGHLHFASLHQQDGVSERVLTSTEKSWRIESDSDSTSKPALSTGFRDYVRLGIGHIATGYDHLVFLFALLLAGGTFGIVVKVVTGFTIGHSITLALASLNIVRPQSEPIEALIGLSIALVAVENVWLLGRGNRLLPIATILLLAALGICAGAGLGRIPMLCWLGMVLFLSCYYPLLDRGSAAESARWAVALIFGLIHGFGFASVLQEAELPTDRLAGALLGFNLGVEAGQITLVAVAWPLLRIALARWSEQVVQMGSAAALCLGVYWMVARNYA
jgi:hypothetical protein